MNPFADKTYYAAIEYIANRYGANTGLIFEDERFTFEDILEKANSYGSYFLHCGLKPGDRIAVYCSNRPEFLWSLLGSTSVGLTCVLINTRLTRDELQFQLVQSGAKAIVLEAGDGRKPFLADFAELYPPARTGIRDDPSTTSLPNLRHIFCCDDVPDSYSGVVSLGVVPSRRLAPEEIPQNPRDACLIMYSSGTTALPKGTVLTHQLWRKAYDAGLRFGTSSEDVFYVAVPMFAFAGLLAGGPMTAWSHGASVVLARGFDETQCLASLEAYGCSVLQMMPSMLTRILAHDAFPDAPKDRWRVALVLTSDKAVLAQAVERLGFKSIVCGYGLTETSALISRTWWWQTLGEQIATNGTSLPGCDVRIVDTETETALKVGEAGEIQVRGYCVMLGYWNNPAETEKTLLPDGWLRTGDLGSINSKGEIEFKGRIRDSYKHNGFNVSTAEVESVAGTITGVRESKVVSLADSATGSIGIAFIVTDDPKLSENYVIQFLSKKLAKYKIPKHVFFVGELPRTGGTDKIRTGELVRRANELLGAAQLHQGEAQAVNGGNARSTR